MTVSNSVGRARELRRCSTESEKKLWLMLRNRQIDGVKFRRQVPIGPYIADFAAIEALLIVEVDGGQHASREPADRRRTAWLQRRGFRVARFWNNDVLGNPEGVIESIQCLLRSG
jgi:very-short-patch-repair endonuclease